MRKAQERYREVAEDFAGIARIAEDLRRLAGLDSTRQRRNGGEDRCAKTRADHMPPLESSVNVCQEDCEARTKFS